MNTNKLMDYGGMRLYCLDGTDIQEAKEALATGSAKGLAVARCRGFTMSDLAVLDVFKNLNVLVIFDAADIDISLIQNIKTLKYLSLPDTTCDLDLGLFRDLEHLRYTASKNIRMPQSGLSMLQELAVWAFPENNLISLSNYRSLRSLEIIQAKKLVSLNGIQFCQELSNLVVAYCPALMDISELHASKALKNLDFENVRRIESYSSLSNLINLEKLIIDKAAILNDLEFIPKLRNLRSVVIRSTPIKSCDLSPLKYLPLLSHLYLDKKKEYEPVLRQLKEQVAFKSESIKLSNANK